MPVTAAFLDYAVELFAPWAHVTAKRMFGGAGLMRDGRMFGLIADDQIYLKVNPETRSAFEAEGSHAFVFVSKAGEGIAMSYWSLPPAALDDTETLKTWAGQAWAAASAPKPQKARSAPKRRMTAKDLADLPLKPAGKPSQSIKKR
jgi:DNA transformation protein and related proteins